MSVLYGSEGYEYPVDDYKQIYILLEAKQTSAEMIEQERPKETKTEKVLCQHGRCWRHDLLY